MPLITSPAVEPIALIAAKAHCKVEVPDDDALITAIIQAAREWVELKTGRALIDQRWERVLAGFDSEIVLPRPPLVVLESVKYLDAAGVQQTLSTSVYAVDETTVPNAVVLAYAQSWPSTRGDPNAVRVRYIAGHACGVTANAGADTLTHSGLRTLANDAVVRLSNSGGALPAPLAPGQDYYVVQAAGSTFKLSLTQGGAAIDITDAGTGQHFVGDIPAAIRQWMLIAIATMYDNRDSVVTGPIVTELKFVDRLLDRYTVPRL